eukprot:633521-Heterocapsa_arctica.AAC.1
MQASGALWCWRLLLTHLFCSRARSLGPRMVLAAGVVARGAGRCFLHEPPVPAAQWGEDIQ